MLIGCADIATRYTAGRQFADICRLRMNSVDEIKAPIAAEMKEFETRFRASMKSNAPLLNRITHYIVKRKGKQMRPMFVLLSAKMFGNIAEPTYTAASLIELLHTATLVHDDVVDDAHERRGFFSLNAIWKNKIAVLVGDYLLSQGLLLSVKQQEYDLLGIMSTAVKEMSEGELLQIEKARKLNFSEEVYYEIIRQKTASLIAACCSAGVNSVGVNGSTAANMRLFGEKVGMAFQIKDDLFDYGNGQGIGKPTGIDIKERKLTLPLIYTLNQVDKRERRRMVKVVKHYNTDKKRVQSVIDAVVEAGGMEYAAKKMQRFRQEALDLLHTMPENDARHSLEGLVNYTVDRRK